MFLLQIPKNLPKAPEAIWSRLWAAEIHNSHPENSGSAADMAGIDYRNQGRNWQKRTWWEIAGVYVRDACRPEGDENTHRVKGESSWAWGGGTNQSNQTFNCLSKHPNLGTSTCSTHPQLPSQTPPSALPDAALRAPRIKVSVCSHCGNFCFLSGPWQGQFSKRDETSLQDLVCTHNPDEILMLRASKQQPLRSAAQGHMRSC